MQRYFILEDENWTNEHVRITGDDVHHISRVMRGKVGDSIICNRRDGKAAVCEISEITDDAVQATIIEWLEQDSELPVEVTIVQGLPKGDKFEYILQKGTELGASRFIPFQAKRSIVVWDKKKMAKKQNRFEKIVKEASEQSHRSILPKVDDVVDLQQLLEISESYDMCVFAYEEEAKKDSYRSFATILKRMEYGMRMMVCIGPEGGFSDDEAVKLMEHGFRPIRLGPRILRTETASLYALSSISYHFEELRWNECKQ